MTRAQHIGKFAYLLSVRYRLIERLRKVVRAKYRQVGVGRFQLFIAVSVDDSEVVVVVFLAYETAGVLTEGTHLVLERLRISDEFGFVKNAVDLFHDLVPHLYSDADIDGTRLVHYVVLSTQVFEPVRAAPARRDDGVFGTHFFNLFAVVDDNAATLVSFEKYVFALISEKYVNSVFDKVLFDSVVYLLRLFRAEVTDRTVNEFESRFDRALSYLLDLLILTYTLNVRVGAEFEINFIRILDHALRIVLTDEFGKRTADLVAERKLAVRERSRTAESRSDMAVWLAIHAYVCLCLRATALFDRYALFDYEYRAFIVVADHLYRGEYSRGTRADDYGIVFHFLLLYFFSVGYCGYTSHPADTLVYHGFCLPVFIISYFF